MIQTGNLSIPDVLKKTITQMFPLKSTEFKLSHEYLIYLLSIYIDKNDKDEGVQLNLAQHPEAKIDATKREKKLFFS